MSVTTFRSETWTCDYCGFTETETIKEVGVDWLVIRVNARETWDKVSWQVCSWECAVAVALNERTRPEGWVPGTHAVYADVLGYRNSRKESGPA